MSFTRAARFERNPNKAKKYEVLKRVESPSFGLNVGRFCLEVRVVETPMGKWPFITVTRLRVDNWHGASSPWKGKFTAPADPEVLRWLAFQLLQESSKAERRIIEAAKALVTEEQVLAEPCKASQTRAGGRPCNAAGGLPCVGPKGGSLHGRYHAARWQAAMAHHGKPQPTPEETL